MTPDRYAHLDVAGQSGAGRSGGASAIRADPRRWMALIVVLIAGFMDLLNVTIKEISVKLTVFGPTGGTGEQILRQALQAGHRVTAMARRPEAITITHPNLSVIQADVLNPASHGAGMDATDAVLSALGTQAMRQPTTVYSQGTAAILTAMARNGVTRFVGISAIPLTPNAEKSLLERRVVHPLLHHFFGGGYDDMRRMERLLADSQVIWTIFRPARLTNGPKTDHYRTACDGRLSRAWSISRADLAEAMLAAVNDTALYRFAVSVAK
jgi:putative NADH-flavin reductase